MGADGILIASPVYDPSPVFARIIVESGSAMISAFTVAPLISIVDKAIVSNASGKEPLVNCLINGVKTLVFNPVYFFRQPSFLFIWGVYGSTYVVANSIEALCERREQSSFYPKFVASSFTNVSLSILKDKAFARMFGVGAPKPVPTSSVGLFATRDTMTILASFSLPGLISEKLEKDHMWSHSAAYNCAQLITPVTMQIFSTPLHLNGLDRYNRSVATNPTRWQFIKQEYVKTTLARMARIFPAFGIGGVVNKHIRTTGKQSLREYYSK